MNESQLLDELKSTVRQSPIRAQYKIPLMVAGAAMIALVFVIVALNLYDSSGAAQLDLSRPGYQSVRNQVGKDVKVKAFSATGGLSSEVFDAFDKQYSEQVQSMTRLDAFGGNVLSDSTLGLPEVENTN